jgi:hypothetical protein
LSDDQESIELLKLDFERWKFSLEQDLEAKKLAVERKKLAVERKKAKWTFFSVVGSVVVACLTIIGSGLLQYLSARTQFELKAADLLLQTNDPDVTAIKAQEFDFLFHDNMSANWENARKSFKAKQFYTESYDLKSQIAKLLIEHPKQRVQIARVYWNLLDNDDPTKAFLTRVFSSGELPAAAEGPPHSDRE